jgi:hypothetical protein
MKVAKEERSRSLRGVNRLREAVDTAAGVSFFADTKDYFKVSPLMNGAAIEIVTIKGVYKVLLNKKLGSPETRIYTGKCGSTKIRVTLKAISGVFVYWA